MDELFDQTIHIISWNVIVYLSKICVRSMRPHPKGSKVMVSVDSGSNNKYVFTILFFFDNSLQILALWWVGNPISGAPIWWKGGWGSLNGPYALQIIARWVAMHRIALNTSSTDLELASSYVIVTSHLWVRDRSICFFLHLWPQCGQGWGRFCYQPSLSSPSYSSSNSKVYLSEECLYFYTTSLGSDF